MQLMFPFAVAICLLATPGFAHHVETSDRALRLLGVYTIAPEPLTCTSGRFKKKRAIDDRHLILRMRGGIEFLAELDGKSKCLGLWKYNRYSIKSKDGDICVGDTISVTQRLAVSGGAFPGDLRSERTDGGDCEIVGIRALERKPKESRK